MIGVLKGKAIFKGEKHIILDVGGVGYKLYITIDALRSISQNTGEEGDDFQFWTHLYVRETSLDLYGFLEKAELEFFEMLINISGVGPKSALGILGVASLDTLKQAISSGDISYLSKVSGIGRKTAEKITVELRDKLGRGLDKSEMGEMLRDEQDAVEALEALGYSLREARDVLRQLPENISGTEDRIKAALKSLGGPKR